MPELPEVETTRRGLLPHVQGRQVRQLVVRDRRLRWPVPADLGKRLAGQRVADIARRGKYLLWHCQTGILLSHLGMSGSLRVLHTPERAQKHDHIDLIFDAGVTVRYTDPRRFGAMLWIAGQTAAHPLLDALGPEPFDQGFDADYLYAQARGRSCSVKEFIMNGHVVVGVGNIYASESLFLAGIHPARAAGSISRQRCRRLVDAIRQTLEQAILAGGSSLRDYVQTSGAPGYFQLQTFCYDREGLPCRRCARPIRGIRQGQRASYFCASCQK